MANQRSVARVEDGELRRRALAGLAAEVEAFGSGAPDSQVIHRGGIVASVVPSAPERSLFNAVYYDDAAALAGTLDDLATTYESKGVRAWAVWVPDDDPEIADLLAARGHVRDSAPRAMALWLDDLAAPPPAPERLGHADGDAATAAMLNDLAYGYTGGAFVAALAEPTDPPVRWDVATLGGQPVACVGTIDVGDDCCVTGVATLPGQRRRGIAGWLLQRVLDDARRRGSRSSSLQAAKAGAGVYERIGFRDLGWVELWERRA